MLNLINNQYCVLSVTTTTINEQCSGSIGRVLGSEPKVETCLSHCVESLSKTVYPLLSSGSNQENILTCLRNVDRDVKYQHKQRIATTVLCT